MEIILEILKPLTAIVALIGGILGGYKIFVEGVLLGKKDELDATRSLVDSCKNNDHDLIIEKTYKVAFRKTLFANEIKYLINLPNTSRIFYLYHSGRKYIEANEGKVQFVEKYSSELKRNRLKIWYFFWYMLSALIAILPAIIAQKGVPWSEEKIGVTLFVFALFGIMAITFAAEYWSIRNAESLIEIDKKSNNQLNKDAPKSGAPVS